MLRQKNWEQSKKLYQEARTMEDNKVQPWPWTQPKCFCVKTCYEIQLDVMMERSKKGMFLKLGNKKRNAQTSLK